jgi:hypothetical protein
MATKKVSQQTCFFPSLICCCWIRDPGRKKIRIQDQRIKFRTRSTGTDNIDFLLIRYNTDPVRKIIVHQVVALKEENVTHL